MLPNLAGDLFDIAISVAKGVFGEFKHFNRKNLISESNLKYLFEVDINDNPDKFFFRMSRCPVLSATSKYGSCNELVLIIIFIIYETGKIPNSKNLAEDQIKLIKNAVRMFKIDQNTFTYLRDCRSEFELKLSLLDCYNDIIEDYLTRSAGI